jgi:hypothetical protein
MASEGYRVSKECRLTLRNLRALDWIFRENRGDGDGDGDDDGDLREELESTLDRRFRLLNRGDADDLRKELESALRRLEKEHG